MVGKWTNDPCSGVDEVVNHFWVLTRRTSAERGILKVVLSIAKITASYVGCIDLSIEIEVK